MEEEEASAGAGRRRGGTVRCLCSPGLCLEWVPVDRKCSLPILSHVHWAFYNGGKVEKETVVTLQWLSIISSVLTLESMPCSVFLERKGYTFL
jgi:hypothetical protein